MTPWAVQDWRRRFPDQTKGRSDEEIASAILQSNPNFAILYPELVRFRDREADKRDMAEGAFYGRKTLENTHKLAARLDGMSADKPKLEGSSMDLVAGKGDFSQLNRTDPFSEKSGNPWSPWVWAAALKDPIRRGLLMGRQADLIMRPLGPDEEITKEEVDELVRIRKELQSIGKSESFKEFENANSFGEAMSEFFGVLETPVIMAEVVTESLAAQFYHGYDKMVGGAGIGAGVGAGLGAWGGPIAPATVGIGAAAGAKHGFAAGMGKTSYNIAASMKYLEIIEATTGEHVMNDPDQLFAVLNDPAKVKEARSKAHRYGMPIGLFDTISFGLLKPFTAMGKKIALPLARAASKVPKAGLLDSAKRMALTGTSKAAPHAAPIVMQSLMGAYGEAGGQLVSEGEITDWKSIFLEGIAEMGMAPFELTVHHLTSSRSPEHAKALNDRIRSHRDAGKTADQQKATVDEDLANGHYTPEQADVYKLSIDDVYEAEHNNTVPDSELGAKVGATVEEALAAILKPIVPPVLATAESATSEISESSELTGMLAVSKDKETLGKWERAVGSGDIEARNELIRNEDVELVKAPKPKDIREFMQRMHDDGKGVSHTDIISAVDEAVETSMLTRGAEILKKAGIEPTEIELGDFKKLLASVMADEPSRVWDSMTEDLIDGSKSAEHFDESSGGVDYDSLFGEAAAGLEPEVVNAINAFKDAVKRKEMAAVTEAADVGIASETPFAEARPEHTSREGRREVIIEASEEELRALFPEDVDAALGKLMGAAIKAKDISKIVAAAKSEFTGHLFSDEMRGAMLGLKSGDHVTFLNKNDPEFPSFRDHVVNHEGQHHILGALKKENPEGVAAFRAWVDKNIIAPNLKPKATGPFAELLKKWFKKPYTREELVDELFAEGHIGLNENGDIFIAETWGDWLTMNPKLRESFGLKLVATNWGKTEITDAFAEGDAYSFATQQPPSVPRPEFDKELESKTDSGSALDFLEEHGTKGESALAARLKRGTSVDVPITTHKSLPAIYAGAKEGPYGRYNNRANSIDISETAPNKGETTLHEIAHAMALKALDFIITQSFGRRPEFDAEGRPQDNVREWIGAINSDIENNRTVSGEEVAAAELHLLFNRLSKRKDFTEHYGSANVDEMIAEAYSNPEFRKYLKSIKVSELEMDAKGPQLRSEKKVNTLWDAFKHNIAKLLGLNEYESSVLDRVMESSQVVIEAPSNLNIPPDYTATAGTLFLAAKRRDTGTMEFEFDREGKDRQRYEEYSKGVDNKNVKRAEINDKRVAEFRVANPDTDVDKAIKGEAVDDKGKPIELELVPIEKILPYEEWQSKAPKKGAGGTAKGFVGERVEDEKSLSDIERYGFNQPDTMSQLEKAIDLLEQKYEQGAEQKLTSSDLGPLFTLVPEMDSTKISEELSPHQRLKRLIREADSLQGIITKAVTTTREGAKDPNLAKVQTLLSSKQDQINDLSEELHIDEKADVKEAHPLFDSDIHKQLSTEDYGLFAEHENPPFTYRKGARSGEQIDTSLIESWRRIALKLAKDFRYNYGDEANDWAWESFAKTLAEAQTRVSDMKEHGRDYMDISATKGAYVSFGGESILRNAFFDQSRKAETRREILEGQKQPQIRGGKEGAVPWAFATLGERPIDEVDTRAEDRAETVGEDVAAAEAEVFGEPIELTPTENKQVDTLVDEGIAEVGITGGLPERTPRATAIRNEANRKISDAINAFSEAFKKRMGFDKEPVSEHEKWGAVELGRRIVKDIIVPQVITAMGHKNFIPTKLASLHRRRKVIKKELPRLERNLKNINGKRFTSIIKSINSHIAKITAGRLYSEEALQGMISADIRAGVHPISAETTVTHRSLLEDEAVRLIENGILPKNSDAIIRVPTGAVTVSGIIKDFGIDTEGLTQEDFKKRFGELSVDKQLELRRRLATRTDEAGTVGVSAKQLIVDIEARKVMLERQLKRIEASISVIHSESEGVKAPRGFPMEKIRNDIKSLYNEFNRERANVLDRDGNPLTELVIPPILPNRGRFSNNMLAGEYNYVARQAKSAVIEAGIEEDEFVLANEEADAFAKEVKKPVRKGRRGKKWRGDLFDKDTPLNDQLEGNFTVSYALNHLRTKLKGKAAKFAERMEPLLKLMGGLDTQVFIAEIHEHTGGHRPAFYDSPHNRVVFDPRQKSDEKAFRVVLEEGLHALTADKLNTDSSFRAGVRRMLNRANKIRKEGGEKFAHLSDYAFSNPYEFLAHAMMDSELQEFLSGIPAPRRVRGGLGNLLQSVINAIAKTLNLNVKEATLLDDVIFSASHAAHEKLSSKFQPLTGAGKATKNFTIVQRPDLFRYSENLSFGEWQQFEFDQESYDTRADPRILTHDEVTEKIRALRASLSPKEITDAFAAAFHGTPRPNVFNKFLSKFIGTGEGATTFGWGLYFTTKAEVAGFYRDMEMRHSNFDTFYGGEKLDLEVLLNDLWDLDLRPQKERGQKGTHYKRFSEYLNDKGYGLNHPFIKDYLKFAERQLLEGSEFIGLKNSEAMADYRLGVLKDALGWVSDPDNKGQPLPSAEGWGSLAVATIDKFLNSNNKFTASRQTTGKIYEVELAPAEDEYLLYDEPHSKQSDKVKKGLRAVENELGELLPHKAMRGGRDIYEAIAGLIPYHREGKPVPAPRGSKGWLAKKKGASLLLLKHGIKGNKFLIGADRGKGKGDYNYVIFDDADIEITDAFAEEDAVTQGEIEIKVRQLKDQLFPDQILTDDEALDSVETYWNVATDADAKVYNLPSGINKAHLGKAVQWTRDRDFVRRAYEMMVENNPELGEIEIPSYERVDPVLAAMGAAAEGQPSDTTNVQMWEADIVVGALSDFPLADIKAFVGGTRVSSNLGRFVAPETAPAQQDNIAQGGFRPYWMSEDTEAFAEEDAVHGTEPDEAIAILKSGKVNAGSHFNIGEGQAGGYTIQLVYDPMRVKGASHEKAYRKGEFATVQSIKGKPKAVIIDHSGDFPQMDDVSHKLILGEMEATVSRWAENHPDKSRAELEDAYKRQEQILEYRPVGPTAVKKLAESLGIPVIERGATAEAFAEEELPLESESSLENVRNKQNLDKRMEGPTRASMSRYEKFKEKFVTKSQLLDSWTKRIFKELGISEELRVPLAGRHELLSGSAVAANASVDNFMYDLHALIGSSKKKTSQWNDYMMLMRIRERLLNDADSKSSGRILELEELVVREGEDAGSWRGTEDEKIELIELLMRSKEVHPYTTVNDIPKLTKGVDELITELDDPSMLRRAVDDKGKPISDEKSGHPVFEGKFVDAQSMSQDHMSRSLYEMYEAGLISLRSLNRMALSTSFYVPFYVAKHFSGEDTFGQLITGIKEETKIAPVSEALKFKLYMTKHRVNRNLFMGKIDEFRREFDPDGKYIRLVEAKEKREVPPNWREVKFHNRGVMSYMQMEADVADLIGHFNPISSTQSYAVMKTAGDIFKLGATGINMFFQAGNFLLFDPIRLLTTSKAGLRAKEKGLNPIILAHQYIKALGAASWRNIAPHSIKNLIRQRAPNVTEGLDQLYQEFVDSGAAGSTIAEYFDKSRAIPDPVGSHKGIHRNPSKIEDALVGANAALSVVGKTLEQTAKMVGMQRMSIFEGLDELQERIDSAPSVEKRMRLEREMRDRRDAIAIEIRNYAGSPDFMRKGTVTEHEALNVVFMFFNARIQGVERDMSRMAKVFSGSKGDRATGMATILKLSAFAAAPTMMVWAMNRRQKDDYDEVSDEEKKRYLMIPMDSKFEHPYIEGKMIRDYIRIPRRESFGLFSYTLEKGLDWLYEEDPDAVAEMVGFWVESMSPVNLDGLTEGKPVKAVESVASSMNPLIKGTFEQIGNRNFFRHKPLIPRSLERADPSEQYSNSTPDIYRWLGESTGLSPLRVKHLADSLTAGMITQFTPPKDIGREGFASTPLLHRLARSSYLAESDIAEIMDDADRVDATGRVQRRRIVDEWFRRTKGMSLQERVRNIPPPKNHNEKLRNDLIIRRLRQQALGLDPDEIRMANSPVSVRASVVLNQVEGMTPAEVKVYLTDLGQKRILTRATIIEVNRRLMERSGETLLDYMPEPVR